MDRAGKAVRRSATRLIMPSTSIHSADLASCCADFNDVSKSMRSLAQTQKEAAESLMKWTLKDDNAAVKDVAFQTNELFQIWADQQTNFAQRFEQCVRQLHKIRDFDKSLAEGHRKVSQLVEKECKLRKDIKKAQKWKKGGDVRLLEHRLQETTRLRELAERQLTDIKTEQEVVKMFRFRQAMQGMADAYRNLGISCTSIFDCHREISELVPAVSTQDVRHMTYDGSRVTRERVSTLRDRLGYENTMRNATPRRASEPIRRQIETPPHVTGAPPPYSAVDPKDNCATCRNRLYPRLSDRRRTP